MKFRFLETGDLIDRELELVAPEAYWIEDVLASCYHPMTRAIAPEQARVTRRQLEDFLEAAPRGHHPPLLSRENVPGYYFWMCLRPEYDPPVPMAGTIGLRVGQTHDLEMYCGHIGYHVYPPARGRHYAERACRLILPLARAHGLNTIWITCNPDNIPSRRTCERLGAELVGVVSIPETHHLYARGEREKCRYRLEI